MTTRLINGHYVETKFKPDWDEWEAWRDPYHEGDTVGFGHTESEAIQDLFKRIDEDDQ